MNFKFNLLVLFSLIAMILSSCQTYRPTLNPSGRQEIVTSKPYLHQQANFIFPTQVSGLKRVKVVRYDRDGLDIGATYKDKTLDTPLVVTAYVYPGPEVKSFLSPETVIQTTKKILCDKHFSQVKEALVNKYKNAVNF